MHFPWKKMRGAKFSQFVNDHLHHSQKRRDGSSLVVETGFPTSLVDLFMKNREKLKKPSKKKLERRPIAPNSDANDSTNGGSHSGCSSPFTASSPMTAPAIAGFSAPSSPLRCMSPLRRPSSLPSKGGNQKFVVDSRDGTINPVDSCVDASSVLMVVFKMFLVVVLALGSHRLTVGITVSAFLLFFMEFAGKYVCGAKGMLLSMLQTVWGSLRHKQVDLDDDSNRGVSIPELQQDHSLKPNSSSSSSLKPNESRNPNQEILMVEPKRYFVSPLDEIQPEIETTENETTVRRLLGYQEEEEEEGNKKKRKSRRAKITSKMKKFVPKKIRIKRKHHTDDSLRTEIVKEDSVLLTDDSQRPDIVREDTVLLSDEIEVCETECEGESDSARSSVSSGNYGDEGSKKAITALSNISEEAETEAKGGIELGNRPIWRYLVLCQIVLVGLIGGRGYALVLTLSWCLLLKLSQILARYLKKGT